MCARYTKLDVRAAVGLSWQKRQPKSTITPDSTNNLTYMSTLRLDIDEDPFLKVLSNLVSIMRLLERHNDGEFSLVEHFGDAKPPYAILSHTWGAEEVTFKDIIDGTGKSKVGYEKILFCGECARNDSLQYFWVDTCCIDKANSTELQEAINSMFSWYREATKCYVYLSDVSAIRFDGDDQLSRKTWELEFSASRWFTRGWTLQELIAPRTLEFFSKERCPLGDKNTLELAIHGITAIPVEALRRVRPLHEFSVDERMSWAKERKTTRQEDAAYCLLGIFDIHMPLIYGEGRKKALIRLRKEIREAQNIASGLVQRWPNDFLQEPSHRLSMMHLLIFSQSTSWSVSMNWVSLVKLTRSAKRVHLLAVLSGVYRESVRHNLHYDIRKYSWKTQQCQLCSGCRAPVLKSYIKASRDY